METIWYIDIYFLVNWMMDAVVLILTGRLLRRRVRPGRICMGAAAGAVWACLFALCFPGRGWPGGISILSSALLMVRLTYPAKEWRELFRGVVCLLLVAALMGGSVHMVYDNTVLGRFWKNWMSVRWTGAVSIWFMAGTMQGSFLLMELGIRYREASKNREEIREVTLYYRGGQCTVQALWDSGNQLYDPFSGQAVHIVEQNIWQKIRQRDPGHPVRWIPCRSLGSSHSLLPVMKITKIVMDDGTVLCTPWIGCSKVRLSGDGSYEMLLHAQTKGGGIHYDRKSIGTGTISI